MIGRVLKKHSSELKCKRHHINLNLKNKAALYVIETLLHAGYETYLVGGAVRDMLLSIKPKDFDVATIASPEQVCAVFRRSRIIGRRFPIVHVMVADETIEVSTFRSGQARQNELGRIVKDNAYGTLEQDAVCRDFTCNALYYDIYKHEIIDFHHGVADIGAKKLVMIGNVSERFQEDPVRILRAIRLSGKLHFQVDDAIVKYMTEYVHLLKKEPPARLFDELLKIVFSGNAIACLQQFNLLGVQQQAIHPLLSALQKAIHDCSNIVYLTLMQTDKRLQAKQSVSLGFVLAALLWPQLQLQYQKIAQTNSSSAAAIMIEAVAMLREQLDRSWGVPQRYAISMREIWMLQPHFYNRRGGKPFRLLAQERFRAAYDFLLLRAQIGEIEQELINWWAEFQQASEQRRKDMVHEQTHAKINVQSEKETVKKKKRRKKKKNNDISIE